MFVKFSHLTLQSSLSVWLILKIVSLTDSFWCKTHPNISHSDKMFTIKKEIGIFSLCLDGRVCGGGGGAGGLAQ